MMFYSHNADFLQPATFVIKGGSLGPPHHGLQVIGAALIDSPGLSCEAAHSEQLELQ